MVVSGLPALAGLAYKSHLINEAFNQPRVLTNEPILMVPRSSGKVDTASTVVEPFLSFICSGIGSLMSPAYLRMKQLIAEYKITPWEMYLNAGCDPQTMMSDFGRKQGMLGRLIKIVSDMIEHPLEMLGVDQNSLPLLLTNSQITQFKNCLPWFVMDVEEYVVPVHKECFLMGRRTDTFHTKNKSYIACKQLGFEIPNLEQLRQQTRSSDTPKQKPPALVEIKPSIKELEPSES
jgi:hypothetical protein